MNDNTAANPMSNLEHPYQSPIAASNELYTRVDLAALGHISNAKGRVQGSTSTPSMCPVCSTSTPSMCPVFNRGGKIDGACFRSYDPETNEIVLRVDQSDVPEFWLELCFTKKQLLAFCRSES